MDNTLGQIIRDLTTLSEECARLLAENKQLKTEIEQLKPKKKAKKPS